MWMFARFFLVFILVLGLSACGSSSGSNSGDEGEADAGSGLAMPGQLSVVLADDDDDDGGGGGGTGLDSSGYDGGIVLFDPEDFPDDAEYFTDDVSIWVYDPSTKPLDQVNMILCHVQKTRARELVNQDPYLALNDPDKCARGVNNSGAAEEGESSGVSYDEFTVVSEHETEDDAHEIQFWIETSGGPEDIEERILGDIRITEAVSDERPFGHFELFFRSETPNSDPIMFGRLATVDRDDGGAQFEFRMSSSDGAPFEMDQWANVLLEDSSGDVGSARTALQENSGGSDISAAFDVAFNETLLLREESGTGDQSCRSRDAFRDSVWRYYLYHMEDGEFRDGTVSAGDRVQTQSGFPFRYERDDGSTNYGHIGYHGIWMDVPETIDGQVVTRGRSNSQEEFTIEVLGGRLTRSARDAMDVGRLQGDILYWWGNDNEYRVTIDENNDFIATHTVEWTEGGPEFTELDNPQTITPAQDGEQIWLWHDALAGEVVYQHDTAINPVDRELLFFDEEQVIVGDGDELFADADPVTLWCRWDCLRGGLTQQDIDQGTEADWFYDQADPGGGPWEYQMDADGLTLLDANAGAEPATLRGLQVEEGHYLDGGVRLTLVTNDYQNETNYFLVPTSYSWDTGTGRHSWRYRAIAESSGNPVDFSAPLRFLYEHSVANDRNDDASYDGRQLMLSYEGSGELGGFPWVQDEETGRWVSPVNLEDGVVLNGEQRQFVVRAIEMDQSLLPADGECGGLLGELPNDGTLPQPDEPVAGNVGFSWQDRPNIDDDPRVVDGEIQD